MKLIDLVPLTEEESSGRITKVKIDILGDEKEVIIDKKGEGLSEPVTISWDEPWGREKHNVEFELDEITDQSQSYNEPSEAIFKGVSDLWEFYVEVELDWNYEESDNIGRIFWEKDRWHNGLEITKEEGSDPRMDPAIRSDFDDPIMERLKKLAGIIKN